LFAGKDASLERLYKDRKNKICLITVIIERETGLKEKLEACIIQFDFVE